MQELDYQGTLNNLRFEAGRLTKEKEGHQRAIAALEKRISVLLGSADQIESILHGEAETEPVVPESKEFEVTSAIREVLKAQKQVGRYGRLWWRPLTFPELRDELISRGWDISGYRNPLAVLHTVLGRLEKAGDANIERGADGKKSLFYGRRKEEEQIRQEGEQKVRHDLPDLCYRILARNEKPMSCRQILRELQKGDVDLNQYGHPGNAVHAALRKHPLVRWHKQQFGDISQALYEVIEAPK